MPEFVRQHRLDLIGIQTVQQGVEKDDALVLAQAGEIGIAVTGAAGAVHDEYAAAGEATALKQAGDACPQRVVIQG